MNPPHQQVHLPLVINVLLLTMIVETKATMRRNMMIATMNIHHHKVHFSIFLPLIMMIGKKRPMMWVRKKFASSTPISAKKTSALDEIVEKK
jgi:Ni,Fe-hydrogenase I large subunit